MQATCDVARLMHAVELIGDISYGSIVQHNRTLRHLRRCSSPVCQPRATSGTVIIGEIREEPEKMVLMHTGFGGTRMIDMLVGDPLPRIC